jgi:hypothetical protein
MNKLLLNLEQFAHDFHQQLTSAQKVQVVEKKSGLLSLKICNQVTSEIEFCFDEILRF